MQAPNVAAWVSSTVSLFRISAESTRSSAGGYALVFLCGPLARVPVASDNCGTRELMPQGRGIIARNRSPQHRSQEMSVRALRRVTYRDGLARLKTLYAARVR